MMRLLPPYLDEDAYESRRPPSEDRALWRTGFKWGVLAALGGLGALLLCCGGWLVSGPH